MHSRLAREPGIAHPEAATIPETKLTAGTGARLRRCSAAAVAALTAVLLAGCSDPPGGLVFDDGFESGDIDLERWERDEKGECEIAVVEDAAAREGARAARFRAGAGARCELLPWFYPPVLDKVMREPFDEDRWYAFSVRLTPPYLDDPQNEVIAQWHASRDWWLGEKRGRGPVLALRIEAGEWRITWGYDTHFVTEGTGLADREHWRGPIEAGRWTDWVARVRWTSDENGRVELWKDGERIVDYRGPTTYNDMRGVYFKIGVYHPGRARVLLVDRVRIGAAAESYESVAPPARAADSDGDDADRR